MNVYYGGRFGGGEDLCMRVLRQELQSAAAVLVSSIVLSVIGGWGVSFLNFLPSDIYLFFFLLLVNFYGFFFLGFFFFWLVGFYSCSVRFYFSYCLAGYSSAPLLPSVDVVYACACACLCVFCGVFLGIAILWCAGCLYVCSLGNRGGFFFSLTIILLLFPPYPC
jgi:hypothetical protein